MGFRKSSAQTKAEAGLPGYDHTVWFAVFASQGRLELAGSGPPEAPHDRRDAADPRQCNDEW